MEEVVAARLLPVELPWLLRSRSIAIPSRRLTVGALVSADLCLFLDAAVRWFHGFGFVSRPRWWLALLAMLAISAGTAWLFTRRPSLGVVHLLIGFSLAVCLLLAAGTSNGVFDWSAAERGAGILDRQLTWADIVVADDLRTTYAGAAIHGLIGARYRVAVRHPALTSLDATLLVAGLSLVLIGWLAKSDFLLQWEPLRNGVLPAKSLVVARASILAALGGAGWLCAGLGATMRVVRLAWLGWVAAGKHSRFSLRTQRAESELTLPVFFGLPLRNRTRVLVFRDGDREHSFARVVL